jgi:integrase
LRFCNIFLWRGSIRLLYLSDFTFAWKPNNIESSPRQHPYKKRRRAQRYERFGEIIRYLTQDELQQFFDSIDQYRHKLMFQVIYELGCRVGEFVRIQVKHVHFSRSTVFFPAENTKTRHPRVSYLPQGLTNELKSLLRQKA